MCMFMRVIARNEPKGRPMLALLERSASVSPYQSDAEATDAKLVEMWLHGRSEHTQRAYRKDAERLSAFCGKPIAAITLSDLQAFADSLTGAASSRGRHLASCKSLLSFCTKIGAVSFNVGAALRAPKGREGLADRILTESNVAKLLALTTDARDHALVRVAYAGGFRVSELVGLRWGDVSEATDGGAFLTVLGKGSKTRTVRISAETMRALEGLRTEAAIYVFPGRFGGHLDASQAWRIVRAAAVRAGLKKPVSPHFLRHSHASHALEKGAKLAVVRDTLGHSSIAVTDRYVHARPGESSGLYLAV